MCIIWRWIAVSDQHKLLTVIVYFLPLFRSSVVFFLINAFTWNFGTNRWNSWMKNTWPIWPDRTDCLQVEIVTIEVLCFEVALTSLFCPFFMVKRKTHTIHVWYIYIATFTWLILMVHAGKYATHGCHGKRTLPHTRAANCFPFGGPNGTWKVRCFFVPTECWTDFP